MSENETKYLIVGGGVAAAKAAQGIREVDADGSVLIVCKEPHPPYDRPPLSKNFLTDDSMKPDDAHSKDPSFYTDKNVSVRSGTEAVAVDRAKRTVTMADGSEVGYEKLLLATGSTPRVMDIPGGTLENVFYLRTIDDAQKIRHAIRTMRAGLMIGAGYIGMEVGASCATCGVDTTIVDPSPHPWSRAASEHTGVFLQRYFEVKGVQFMLGDEVTEITGQHKVEGVKTKSGKSEPADFVVIGVGVHQNLSLAKQAGIEVDDDNGVIVNERLQTSDPNIFAAGDIAFFQDVALGKRWHAEHYLNANWQGIHVGKSMTGDTAPYDKVAYFFSDMFDLHMIQRGDPHSASRKILGKMPDGEFIELYGGDDDILRMGLAFSKDEKKLDPYSDKLEELIRTKAKIGDLNLHSFV